MPSQELSAEALEWIDADSLFVDTDDARSLYEETTL